MCLLYTFFSLLIISFLLSYLIPSKRYPEKFPNECYQLVHTAYSCKTLFSLLTRKKRLDEICLERFQQYSRTYIQSWILQGNYFLFALFIYGCYMISSDSVYSNHLNLNHLSPNSFVRHLTFLLLPSV